MPEKIHRGFFHRLRAQVEHGVDADKVASTVSHELSIVRSQEYSRGFHAGFEYAIRRAIDDPSFMVHHMREYQEAHPKIVAAGADERPESN